MKSLQTQVIEFHKAMGQPILDRPTIPDDARVRLRAQLVIEEALEFVEALFGGSDVVGLPVAKELLRKVIVGAPVKVDLPAAIDALADIDYVVAGSYLEFGVDSGPIAREVHRANMAKADGPVSPEGKRLKPEGWTPPDIERELEFQRATVHGGLGHKLITLRNAFDAALTEPER